MLIYVLVSIPDVRNRKLISGIILHAQKFIMSDASKNAEVAITSGHGEAFLVAKNFKFWKNRLFVRKVVLYQIYDGATYIRWTGLKC